MISDCCCLVISIDFIKFKLILIFALSDYSLALKWGEDVDDIRWTNPMTRQLVHLHHWLFNSECVDFFMCVYYQTLCYTHRNQCNVKRLNMVFVAVVEIQFEIFILKHLFGRSMDEWMQWQRLICHWMVFIEFIHRIHLKFQIFEMFRWRDRFNQMLDDIRAYSLQSISEFFSLHASSSTRLVTSRQTILTCLLKCTNVQIS